MFQKVKDLKLLVYDTGNTDTFIQLGFELKNSFFFITISFQKGISSQHGNSTMSVPKDG